MYITRQETKDTGKDRKKIEGKAKKKKKKSKKFFLARQGSKLIAMTNLLRSFIATRNE